MIGLRRKKHFSWRDATARNAIYSRAKSRFYPLA
jgi:hypothetical protein